MFTTYFKVAWRNILKNKFYSLVNIFGLAVGIAFTMQIGIYAWSELQVNKKLKNADRQYIIQSKWKDPNQGLELTSVGPLAKALKETYPNLVANYYRWDGITSTVSKGDRIFREGLQIGDSTLLHIYGFSLLYGNAKTAFEAPYSVVLTKNRAIKYFGRTNIVGETINIESFSGTKHDFLVTGVLENPFRNSITHITEDNDNQVYISTKNLDFFGRNMNWNNPYIVSYIELQKGVSPNDLKKPLQELMKLQALPQIAANMTPFIVPLKDYYLDANNGIIKKMLLALSAIALFILLMAMVNFVNLSISRSTTRMREIGIRKVVGGLKQQIILQFLIESTLIVCLSTMLAIIIYSLSSDGFSAMLSVNIPSILTLPAYFVLIPIGGIILVGFLAGLYPAFVLSSLNTIDAVKGKLSSIRENIFLRKSLVTFQFTTAAIVCIAAIIITQQVNFFFSKNLGYDKDFLVSIQVPRDWTAEGVQKIEQVRKQFAQLPQVKNTSLSFEVPDGNSAGNLSVYKSGADSTTANTTTLLMTDENYAATFNIPMAAGEYFGRAGAVTDNFKVVINETQSALFGFSAPQEALGQQLRIPGDPNIYTVAGVTKDFHFGSMQSAILPITVLQVNTTFTYRVLTFKLRPGPIGESIAALQYKWNSLLPGTAFEYRFMDETLSKVYKTELQLKKASYAALVLSGIIVLLGVLGLVSLSVQKRVREIGIRKVLGAATSSIMRLFLAEFIQVIAIASLIAIPLTWLLMSNWLNNYAYRISITPVPFITAVFSLGCLTSILIIIQTLKAANANPVESLKSE
ncbi:ABC transporter permease [Flavihumibacter fluvii]|uniref:ABC transporter permease n=1 Tax=Flavihumibacter fluvii TaxID=2838157 RepID=UPI001BDE8722|nr:ABC transporter permease [Flavihumibacter fluvii]ULQ54153.1 ABC transporter permease [Flavihumibacter fluvii]